MRPPPVTLAIVWLEAPLGPSEPMNARRSSLAPLVVSAGAAMVEAAELWRVVTVLSSAKLAAAVVVIVIGADCALSLPAAS